MAEPKMYWVRTHTPIRAALCPDGSRVVGGSNEQTFKAWNERCAVLGVSYDNPFAEFHDAACRALPEEQRATKCAYVGDRAPELLKRRRIVSLAEVIRFLKTAASWALSGTCVEQEEANRRAAICAACPLNTQVYMGGCAACTSYMADMFAAIGSKRTTSNDALQSCEACGCENKVQVWVPLPTLQQYAEGLELPDWCWKKSTSA